MTEHGRGSIGSEGNFCLVTEKEEEVATVVYLAKSKTLCIEYREEDGLLRGVNYNGVEWETIIAILNTKANLGSLIRNFVEGKYETRDLGITNA